MATALRQPDTLTIGEVADEVGLNASAIRYYEAARLLPAANRVGGKRRYTRDTVDLLLLIRFCQRLGFNLDEIRKLLSGPLPALPRGRGRETSKDKWRAMVDAKLEEVASLIRSARAVERVLRESRDCDCVTPSSCRFVRREARLRELDNGYAQTGQGKSPIRNAGRRLRQASAPVHRQST